MRIKNHACSLNKMNVHRAEIHGVNSYSKLIAHRRFLDIEHRRSLVSIQVVISEDRRFGMEIKK